MSNVPGMQTTLPDLAEFKAEAMKYVPPSPKPKKAGAK